MTPLIPQTIDTARLHLRQPQLCDLEAYVAYYTGPRTGGVGGPKPRRQVVDRFLSMAGQWPLRGFGRYTITYNSDGIGHVGVMQADNTDPIELTWTLWDGQYEGQGIATEAAQAVLDAWQGPELIVSAHPENQASARVAEKLGFVPDETSEASPIGMRPFRHAGRLQ